jgi:hypothetical protein
MREHKTIGCSTLVLAALMSSASPVAACPWNGCGTDAYNSYVASTYDYYYPVPATGPQVYGYGPQVYAYGPPVAYGYANPPIRYYSRPAGSYYRSGVADGWRRW